MANQVGEIQIHTEPFQWRQVSTKFNPADEITTGVAVKGIANSNSWWSGPEFLETTENEWPRKEC